jgi:hypothetical protein
LREVAKRVQRAVVADTLILWRVSHVGIADAVNLRAGHRPARIDERIEDKPRRAAGIDADDGDFDDAVGTGVQPGRLEVEDRDRCVGNRERSKRWHRPAFPCSTVSRSRARIKRTAPDRVGPQGGQKIEDRDPARGKGWLATSSVRLSSPKSVESGRG